MKCTECGHLGDWIGTESGWEPVHGDVVVMLPLVECRQCGYRQRIG